MDIYKKWLIKLGIASSIALLPLILYVVGFNYYIDPLWNFKHSNKYNQYQDAFDERQLKTNLITNKSIKYDTLIVGTSRTTYINQFDFQDLKAFNYSVSSMHINEYNDYINYAKKANGDDFKIIVLEVFPEHLDFPQVFQPPNEYFNIASGPLYKFKSLLSYDTYQRAKTNYELSKNQTINGYRSYNRKNVASARQVTEKERALNVNKQLQEISQSEKYVYTNEYKKNLTEIKNNNPNAKFILFSPPYSKEYFVKSFGSREKFEGYRNWLKDCVDVFGEVYNFMYINSITKNKENYYDAFHFYPNVGTLIAHRLIEYEIQNLPTDFGVLVNENNLEEHMRFIESQLN